MHGLGNWVDERNVALLVDQYELALFRAYLAERLIDTAVFSLFVRELPPGRNYLLACGLETVVDVLEELRFGPAEVEAVQCTGIADAAMLHALRDFRFTGDVWAAPEGTPVFAQEPLLQIVAPLPQAQLVETIVMNQVHLQTLLASKASRVVQAAAGRDVVDFGLRRAHGADAGLKAARAAYVAGAASTSNVLAGALYGIPVVGTMAHSWVQAHATELRAFHAWCVSHPASTLLVDTYDTLQGVRNVVRLARDLGPNFHVRAIRLDSGDLADLSRKSRARLDEAGLHHVRIVASGGLDEHEVHRLVTSGAPIDAFGVGTAMSASSDAPALDCAYRLVEYAGRPTLKLSTGKVLLPGRKQVFRERSGDVIARFDEPAAGRRPLLEEVMREGRRVRRAPRLADVRARAAEELARLPQSLRGLEPAGSAWPVAPSASLRRLCDEAQRAARASCSGSSNVRTE